jgi:hypothetical protein
MIIYRISFDESYCRTYKLAKCPSRKKNEGNIRIVNDDEIFLKTLNDDNNKHNNFNDDNNNNDNNNNDIIIIMI